MSYSAEQWELLEVFYAAYNSLTGHIPDSLQYKRLLSVLLLNNNMLSGTIPRCLGSTQLSCLDLSSNSLTGSVPPSLFANTSLVNLILAQNCLTWTIVERDLCRLNATMQSLIMDSIHSDVTCQTQVFPKLLFHWPSYGAKQAIFGSIPSCIFTEFHSLHSLHLSGNSMTGSLPSGLKSVTHNSLRNLSLSYNFLSGTIPSALQTHNWTLFDLSFNKFQGSIVNDFCKLCNMSSATIDLKINQLSGTLPTEQTNGFIRNAHNINLLTGNLFACDVTRNTLPRHDQDFHGFQCGSDSVDNSVFVWLVMVFVVLCLLVGYRLSKRQTLWALISEQWHITTDTFNQVLTSDGLSPSGLDELHTVLMHVQQLILMVFAVMIGICLPCYVILSQIYATVKPSYAWELSVANKEGPIAACLMLIVLIIVFGIVWWRRVLLTSIVSDQVSTEAKKVDLEAGWTTIWQSVFSTATLLSLLLLAFNCAVVMTVTVSYVQATSPLNTNYSALIKQCIAVGASMFKIVWNVVALSQHKRLERFRPQSDIGAGTVTRTVRLLLLLVFFNNIIVPCLAVVIYNENCMYNVFVAPPNITSSYAFFSFFVELVRGVIVAVGIYVSQDISAPPPFQYRYRCTSTLLMVFADVFIYRYVMISIVIPLGCLLIVTCRRYLRKDNCLYRTLGRMLPSLWGVMSELECVTGELNDFKIVFETDKFLLSLVNDMAILLVFGAVFPLIAIVGVVSIASNLLITRYLLGRILYLADHNKYDSTIVSRIKTTLMEESAHILKKFTRLLGQLLWLVPIVWGAFLFDVIGGTSGSTGAIWMLCMTGIALPWICFGIEKSISLNRNSVDDRRTNKGIEMPDSAKSSRSVDSRDSSTVKITNNPIYKAKKK